MEKCSVGKAWQFKMELKVNSKIKNSNKIGIMRHSMKKDPKNINPNRKRKFTLMKKWYTSTNHSETRHLKDKSIKFNNSEIPHDLFYRFRNSLQIPNSAKVLEILIKILPQRNGTKIPEEVNRLV